jgi:hypothetical protein
MAFVTPTGRAPVQIMRLGQTEATEANSAKVPQLPQSLFIGTGQ